jgi:hypothetical protein
MNLVHRVLFVAWRSPRTRGIYPVARLLQRESAPQWELAYIEGAHTAAAHGFVPFIEFPQLERAYESEELFPLFQNRLMPSKRADYREFLARLALPESTGTPITILSRSGGRRETDKLEVFGFPSFDPARARYVYLFFLRGVRHVPGAEERIARLAEGERLAWRREPDNPIDRLSIVVDRPNAGQLGWVPAALLGDLTLLIDGRSRVEVFAERANLAPAPVHERLLCRLEATAIAGFVPFSDATYQPIPEGATALHLDPAELVA